MQRPFTCRICGSTEQKVLYQGLIRTGSFGQLSAEPQTVWECGGCQAGYLPGQVVDYASGEYRALVDGNDTPEEFYRLHDAEQGEKLRILGTGGLRGAVLMDVGCGAGSFLDLVKGFCKSTIGIEPTPSLRAAVAAKTHLAFPYCSDVPDTWRGRVDVAVSFSVIEHLEDPLSLLRDIRRLLKPGGRLLLSTPNRRDWLLELLPNEYAQFFYRKVHTWYFDAEAITKLARLAGFADASVSYAHRYDLSNGLLWLRDKRPTGLGRLDVTGCVDGTFRSMLEATGRADYLYCSCVNA
jgi:2-polyprenyl-3-methyl-5-hydroxy-6-metoxy-1,4-benzoquinol methylase